MDELLAQFLIEGPELIQEGGEALLALEARPDDRDLLDGAFRAMHTLKGSVGLFDLPAMGRALHAAEDVLGDLRARRRVVEPAVISALLAVLAQSERWIGMLERTGSLPREADGVAARLISALSGEVSPMASQSPEADAAWAGELAAAAPQAAGALVAVRYRPKPGSYFAGDDPIALAKATPGLLHLILGLTEVPGDAPYDPFVCRLSLDLLSEAALDEVTAVFRFVPDQVEIRAIQAGGATPAEPPPSESSAVRTLRIDPRRVDSLAATAADLMAATTGISALAAAVSKGAATRAVAETLSARSVALERLVGRLHDAVMALRMAPIAPLLRRYPRLVRELAASLGKDAELIIDDPGLEADKAILEGLSEPLTHLVRNAIDHGVEPPAARHAAGKPTRAVVRLSARRDGANLVLELRDDGRGIDPAAIRRKVIDQGLMTPHAMAELSEAAILDLVFLPGFSTAESVTEVSGRGVGMDAVKTAIGRLGGRIRLASEAGAGTCVTLVLPLSLVLSKIMVVEAAGERFGAPMDRVLETLKLPAGKISDIRAGRAFNWRNRTVPLLLLSSLVGGEDTPPTEDLRVLVVQCESQTVGIAVDAIVDRTDVVMRPMTGLLAAMPGMAGSTVLADGQVLMILDIAELVG